MAGAVLQRHRLFESLANEVHNRINRRDSVERSERLPRADADIYKDSQASLVSDSTFQRAARVFCAPNVSNLTRVMLVLQATSTVKWTGIASGSLSSVNDGGCCGHASVVMPSFRPRAQIVCCDAPSGRGLVSDACSFSVMQGSGPRQKFSASSFLIW